MKANFEQDLESWLSISNEDNINRKLEYFGTIQDIIKVDFRKFNMFIFDVRWFKVVTQGEQSTTKRQEWIDSSRHHKGMDKPKGNLCIT